MVFASSVNPLQRSHNTEILYIRLTLHWDEKWKEQVCLDDHAGWETVHLEYPRTIHLCLFFEQPVCAIAPKQTPHGTGL